MKARNIQVLVSILVVVSFCSTTILAQQLGLKDEGVGIYSGPTVADQVSTFTITKNLTTCGVGTITPLGDSGPFEMLMFSLRTDSYTVDRSVPRTIRSTGKMRSITRVGGIIVEDTDGTGVNPPPHDFVALGFDKDAPQRDRFEIHFKTPFWNTGNPLCTPSSIVEEGCFFGDDLILGDIVVQPGQTF